MVAPALESAPATVQRWRELYKEAIAETVSEKLPTRISEAEKALALRSQELFALPGENLEERQELSNAQCVLRALRFCLRLKTGRA